MSWGIVIGKFCPFHKGHEYLIRTACEQVDYLIVYVVNSENDSVPVHLRVDWIREAFPIYRGDKLKEINVIPDIYKDDDSKAWADHTLDWLERVPHGRGKTGKYPDFVFTSEDYGEKYSEFLNSKHIMVDRERKHVPISATEIKRDPLKFWDFISPCVRSYYAKRVCVVGAESTGTTTIARDLAKHYGTLWVPEYGRLYTEGLYTSHFVQWKTEDFIFIAEQQNKLEDKMARDCNRLLFCDTNSFATSLWHERYMGFKSEEVELIGSERKYDLYLLTDVNIPFVQDGYRDGESIREKMHERFIEELDNRGERWILLTGSPENRLRTAIDSIGG